MGGGKGKGKAIALTTLFGVLGCVMVATLIYTICTSGLPFHRDLLTWWMAATLLDFYINAAAIGAWVFYKESSWIMAGVWIVLLVCFGSITTCGYIVLQFIKLSPEESLEDPVYFVLVRRWRKDGTEQKKRHSVVGARIIFTALGFLMLGTLIYVGIRDDSSLPDILTPWMITTLIDFYINVVALSVWVTYKESSWIRALVWIFLLAFLGSTVTCAYIVWQLSHLSSQDPLYLVLFNRSNRADLLSESQRIQYAIQTRTQGIPDARTYLLTLKEMRIKRGLTGELGWEAMTMDVLEKVEKELKKPLMRNDKKGMALLNAEFDKINKKLNIRKEDLPKYEEQLELKLAKEDLEEVHKDCLEAMETQRKREEFQDEEMVDVKSLDIRNFL